MGWFSPLKGQYPSLAQIDKTLSVGSDEVGIVRGSLVYVGAGNVFRLAGAAQAADVTALLYFALVGQDDFQAGMAGTIGQGPGTAWNGSHGINEGDPAPAVIGGSARITALACNMPLEFQTDQFDDDAVYTVGTLLTSGAGGKLTPHTAGTANVVAQVTAVPFERWVNDAVAVEGRRTGAVVSVINARTLWVPALTLGS